MPAPGSGSAVRVRKQQALSAERGCGWLVRPGEGLAPLLLPAGEETGGQTAASHLRLLLCCRRCHLCLPVCRPLWAPGWRTGYNMGPAAGRARPRPPPGSRAMWQLWWQVDLGQCTTPHSKFITSSLPAAPTPTAVRRTPLQPRMLRDGGGACGHWAGRVNVQRRG